MENLPQQILGVNWKIGRGSKKKKNPDGGRKKTLWLQWLRPARERILLDTLASQPLTPAAKRDES